MNVLCLGNSNIGRKRAFPALDNFSGVTSIDIASRSNSNDDAIRSLTKLRDTYGNYEEALECSDASMVYISTTNDTHFALAEEALEAGKHVVVEKPAAIEMSHVERLLALAEEKSLLLAEAVVYCFHPQAELVRSTMSTIGRPIGTINLKFLIPDFPMDNYRYEKKFGGGALWDMGVYATSLPRVLFPSFIADEIFPEQIKINCKFAENGIDTRFDFEAKYGEEIRVVGDFGYGAEYQNSAKLIGEEFSIDVERVFAKPDDMKCRILVDNQGTNSEYLATEANIYSEFWTAIDSALQAQDYKSFADKIRYDANCVDRLRSSVRTK